MEQCGFTLSSRWQSVAVRLKDHRQEALPAIMCLSITVCHNETPPLGTVWLLNSSNSQRPQGTNYFLKHWHDIFTQLLWIEQTWLGLKYNCLKKKIWKNTYVKSCQLRHTVKWSPESATCGRSVPWTKCCSWRPPCWSGEALRWTTLKILHCMTLIHCYNTQRHHNAAPPPPLFTLIAKAWKASATNPHVPISQKPLWSPCLTKWQSHPSFAAHHQAKKVPWRHTILTLKEREVSIGIKQHLHLSPWSGTEAGTYLSQSQWKTRQSPKLKMCT